MRPIRQRPSVLTADNKTTMQRFQVIARIGFVNDSDMDVPFTVRAQNEDEVRKLVTPDYVMTNVSDDWGVPIQHVTVLRIEAIDKPRS